MMKALVVGGTGFTGPYIIQGLIDRGYQVTILHRGIHETDDIPPELEHIHADPHWPEQLEQALEGKHFDLVVSTHGRLRYVAEAVKGHTERLVAIGGEAVFKGWLRVSHPHMYQNLGPSPVPVDEESWLEDRGVDHFVDRMLETEDCVMQCHQEGYYNATLFRYAMGYGPRHLACPEWSIVRRILEGRKQFVLPNNGQVIVCKGFGQNEAHGVLLAVDKPDASAGQIYNISDEIKLTNRQWVELICRIMDWEFEFIDMPLNIVQPGYLVAWPPALCFPYHEVMDITKVQTQLGYRQIVPTEKAIEISVKWQLEHPPKPGGTEEQNISDPFDYEAEDRLIQRLKTTWDQLWSEALGARYDWRHPYPHPQKRGDLR